MDKGDKEPEGFEEDRLEDSESGGLLTLDLEGFEGPIHVLLELARNQKVDILQISMTQLAEQYLDFIRQAKELRLELAADYLVMAAWNPGCCCHPRRKTRRSLPPSPWPQLCASSFSGLRPCNASARRCWSGPAWEPRSLPGARLKP